MAQFRFARDAIGNSLTTSDVVNRAELLAHIQRNVVYLRDLTEPNLLIIPPPPAAARGSSSLRRASISSGPPDYGIIGRRTVNLGGTVELLCVIDLRAAI
jgi:hypothetical protein